MKHLDEWERHQGQSYQWELNESMREKNETAVVDLVCRYDVSKVYRSKGGSGPTPETKT